MVVLKLEYNGAVRRFSNVRPNCINFTQFLLDARQIFPGLSGSFTVKYVDDENELVLIGDNAELQDAIAIAEREKRNSLRLTLQDAVALTNDFDMAYPSFLGGEGLPSLRLDMPQGAISFNSSQPMPRDPFHDDLMPESSWNSGDTLVYAPFSDLSDFPQVPQSQPQPQALVQVDTAPAPLPRKSKPESPASGAPAAKQGRRSAPAQAAPRPRPVKAAAPAKPAATAGKSTKVMARRARNRVSARKSRMRKKLYHDSLQAANDALTTENKRLKVKVKELEGQIAKIKGEVVKMAKEQETLKSENAAKAKATSTNIGTTDMALLKSVHVLNKSFCICDPNRLDNPIIYCSDSFVTLTGYPRSEILGRNCRFLQGPLTDPKAVHAIRTAIEQGCDAEVQILNYRKDGSTFWNNFFIASLRDESGKVVNFVGVQSEMKVPPNVKPEQHARAVKASGPFPKGETSPKVSLQKAPAEVQERRRKQLTATNGTE